MFTIYDVCTRLEEKIDGQILNFAKQIARNTIVKYLEKIRGVNFIHTADIMYPHEWGPTPIQLLIVSRYLDSLLWVNGNHPVWHIRLAENNEYVMQNINKFTKQYEIFLSCIKINGFNPAFSQLSARQTPFFGVHDGTHRLGYLLSVTPNSFVPVKISHPILRQPTHPNGCEWLFSLKLKNEYINELVDEYERLQSRMRRFITAFFYNDKEFETKYTQVLNEFDKVSKIVSIQNDLTIGDKRKAITVVKFELPYQDLYFRHGRLKSRRIDILKEKVNRFMGGNGWDIAPSVTESIILEKKIFNYNANYRDGVL